MRRSVNDWLVGRATNVIESGWAPDWATRAGIRRLCRQRKASLQPVGGTQVSDRQVTEDFLRKLQETPVAVATEEANDQHYELPPEFFSAFLGPRRKYSGCIWPEHVSNLAEAEVQALEQVCQRGQLQDGMQVLELGCGWGSLTLWILENYPNCRVTAVSNSAPQRRYIEGRAEELGVANRLSVITADMNQFEAEQAGYDRVFSIEMFEHMRNHGKLLQRIRRWIRPDGQMFVHIFCHRETPYLFETTGASNWMGRYFFTGGMMPSFDLLRHFPESFSVEEEWAVNGRHYSRTLEAWLDNFDQQSNVIDPILADVYGKANVTQWRSRWRVFLMACSELFAFDQGEQWFVGHYRLRPTT